MVLKYDPTIQPGDIITAYHKGYWKVTKVIPRADNTPTFEYIRIDKKGSKSCDASYCRKVDPNELYQTLVDEAAQLRDMLMIALNAPPGQIK